MENFNRLNDLYFKKLLGDKKRKNYGVDININE